MRLSHICFLVFGLLLAPSQASTNAAKTATVGIEEQAAQKEEPSLPSLDASPEKIVDYLIHAPSAFIREGNDDPVTNRILSASLKALWRGANAAALRLDHDNYFDYNWILTGQDFELASRTLVSPTPNMVVAYLKGAAGETPIVTYWFTKDSGAWKLYDVSYGGGTSPVQLSNVLQNEIDKGAPPVRLPSFRKSYDGSRLQGPAAKAVREFLFETPIHCEFSGVGAGGCRLGALTDSVDLHYVDGPEGKASLAVAFIEYFPNDGNAGDVMIAVWAKDAKGLYDLQASGLGPSLEDTRVVGMDGDRIVLGGLTVGPNDTNCCATDATTLRIAYLGGLDVIETRRVPLPTDERYIPRLPFVPLRPAPQVVTAAATRAPQKMIIPPALAIVMGTPDATMTFAKPHKVSQVSNISAPVASKADRGEYSKTKLQGSSNSYLTSYDGEAWLSFFHNGSEMMVFSHHGIIVYQQPKDTLGNVVKQGDLLFEGRFEKAGIVGTAFLFKAGCPPLPYRVSGPAYDFNADKLYKVIVLRGAAPIHDRKSCSVVGTTTTGANAVLRFEPAAAYAE